MSKYLNELKSIFEDIKNSGWHDTTRVGNTGIGKTFEDLLEKEEDNYDLPDFGDIEIKTHDEVSKSMITLFTKSPDNPKSANTFLRVSFGKRDEYGNKILHSTVSGNRKTKSLEYEYDFKVEVEADGLRLYVYDKKDRIVNKDVYWSKKSLEKQLNKKLLKIAIISAETRESNGKRQYKYNKILFIDSLNIEIIMNAIKNGDLKIDIRIGAYHQGAKKGKTHDHGTGFRIMLNDLVKYVELIEI